MPSSYPSSLDTTTSLSTAVNGLAAFLNGDHASNVTTITVNSTAGAASAGYVTIDSEVIKYAGITSTTLTGCTRGADGTAAASHNNGSSVKFGLVADHHNSLVTAVIGLQNKVGLNTGGASATSIDAGQLAAGSSAAITALTTSGLVTGTGLRDSRGIAGANAMVKLDEVILGGVQAVITFNPISSAFRHLKVIWQGRGDNASANIDVRVKLNNDGGANYDGQVVIAATATTLATTETLGSTNGIHVGWIPAATGTTAGYFGGGEVIIPNYIGATANKQVIAVNVWAESNATGLAGRFLYGGGKWRTTATAVTRLDFLVSAGNFVAGTVFSLYGY